MTWTTTRLKYVARVGYGLGQPPALSESGIPILRATNITRGRFTSEGLIFAAKADLPLNRAPLLREGEILVVRSGAYTGDSAIVTDQWAGSAPGYDLRLSPVDAHPGYLAYCMLSRPLLDQIDLAKARAAQPHLNAEDLGEATVELPSLDEQRRIADFLDAETARIEELVRLRNLQVDLLAEALRNEAARIRSAEWRLLPLRRIVESVQTGTTPTEILLPADPDKMPWYTPAALGGTLDLSNADKSISKEDFHAVPRFHADSVLIVGIGESLGKVADLNHEATGNQQLTAIRISSSADRRFVLWRLFAAYDEIRAWAQYSRVRILNNEVLKSFRIPVPALGEQIRVRQDLDHRLAEFTGFRNAAARFSQLAGERRRAVITAAVTGRITL